jgi:hypothetical protein
MIRINAIWLATEPMDIHAGTEIVLTRVIAVFNAVKPHFAYLFANGRATRMKVLVQDGIGVWLATCRLNQGKSHWQAFGKVARWRGSADALLGRWGCAHRQQCSREPDPAIGSWALKLIVCWIATLRKTGSGCYELDAVCAHEKAGSVCVA